jgi:NADPH:quinone reductase-like Zn-dependent oxidoreductase
MATAEPGKAEDTPMKAIVYTKHGPPEVLQLKEVPIPVPTDNQILVRVHAASINALESRRFSSQLKGTRTRVPLMVRVLDRLLLQSVGKVIGADIAGRVEAVGAAVMRFQPGDEVFGVATRSAGGFAEYACSTERGLALKPANLSFEEAAAVPVAAVTALQGLRNAGHIRSGQKVLVNGASGAIGTFAMQIAKAFGAEVTAVCSRQNLDQARSIGADHVIDYTREDFTKKAERYDLILAINGYHPILAYKRALSPGGTYIMVGGSLPQGIEGLLLAPLVSKVGRDNKQLRPMGVARINHDDLAFIGKLLEERKVVPVIERRYPLNEVAKAIRYLAEGHAKAKVVITVLPTS